MTADDTLDIFFDGAVDGGKKVGVFLAYARAADSADSWLSSCEGKLELDPTRLELLYSGSSTGRKNDLSSRATPLGTVVDPAAAELARVSVNLPAELAGFADGGKLYFQAIATTMQSGVGVDWENRVVSPLLTLTVDASVP